jgi:hypothetical protein
VNGPSSPFCSQIQKWVSSGRGVRPSPVIAGFGKSFFARRAYDVAEDFDCTFHPAEKCWLFFVHWNQTRHGLTALRDDDFLPALLDLIQEVQALGLELAGADFVLRVLA